MNAKSNTKSFLYRTAAVFMITMMLCAALPVSSASAAVSQPSAWTSQYASATYPAGAVNAAYSVAAGANRLLVVAIASTRTTAGNQTVSSVTYGGQALTLAAGDAASTGTWNHSYLYYLKESGIQAASGTSLNVTIAGGTSFYNWVYAAVFANVDQTTPFTDAKNFNSGATADATVGPFSPTLTIATGDQAIEIINIARDSTGNTLRSISTFATGWTTAGIDQNFGGNGTQKPHLYIRNRNLLTAANDGSQHTADSNSTWDSMTAMSIKPATTTVGDGTTPSSKTVKGSDTNKAVSAFTLATGSAGTTDTVIGMTVTVSGTGPANVGAVKIYHDNGAASNEWDASDTLMGTATYASPTATFTGLTIAVTNTATQYLITLDTIASPVNGQTMLAAVATVTASNNVTNSDSNDATLTVDSVAPTVSSIIRADANPTSAASVSWIVTFSESVTSVGTNDFTLVTTGGITGESITSVTGSGPYTVTANTGSGNGTLGLNIAGSPTITDTVGNALTAGFTGQVYTVTKLLASTTSIASDNNPSIYGSSIGFTATVTTGATGNVEFYDGVALIGTVALNAGTPNEAVLNISTLNVAGSPHSITAAYVGDSTYASSTSSVVSQVVNPKPVTVTPDAGQNKVYGASDPTFTYTNTALVGGDSLTGNLSRAAGTNVGTYNFTLGTLSAGSNYSLSLAAETFEITAKPITVTPDAGQSKVYGASDPTFTYTNTPLVGIDSFTGNLGRAVGENVGTYSFTLGTLSAGSNYSLSLADETFEITAKPITVTPDAGQSKVYGATDPTFTYTNTALIVGDSFTGNLGRVAGENVGNFSFTLGTLSAGSNYSLSLAAESFEITAKPITVTPDAGQSKVYGASDPTFTYTNTALVGGDSLTGSLGRAAGENVGTYNFTLGTLSAGSNYTLSLAAETFEITKATPTLSVTNSPVNYNGSPQAATVAGSVAGVVSNIQYDGSSTIPTDVGTYAVTADFAPTDTTNYNSLTGASAGNFAINANQVDVFIGGNLEGSYQLLPSESIRDSYVGVDSGPVKIASTNGIDILAALRVIWREPGQRYSYSEMMGLPKEQLSSEYWFPWYNNLDTAAMDQGFRIANVDTVSGHTIEVWVGNSVTPQATLNLGAGASIRVGYPVNNGPVRIVCTDCTGSQKIIAALRVIWKEPGQRYSYSEMMGLPKEQLSTEYWFPWYNNANPTTIMDQGFRIALP